MGKHAFLCAALILAASMAAAFGAPIWPQWKYDMQLTGHCPYIGPDTAMVQWTFSTGDTFTIRYSAPVIGGDGTIYFGGNDSFLFAVNPEGQEKWRYKTRGIPGLPAIDQRGRIFFGVNNFEFLAIDDSVTYGKLAWSWGPGDTSSYSCSPVVVGPDRTVYITFDSMRAFDSTGALKWSGHRGEYGAFPPAISLDGQYMYYEYVPDPFNVTLVKADKNNNHIWVRNIGGAPSCLTWGSPAIGSDSTVYFAAADGRLHAIRPNNTDKWAPISGLGFNLYMTATLGMDDTIWLINRQKRPQYWIFSPDDGSEIFEDSINVTPSRYNYYNSFITDGLGRAYIILRDSAGGASLASLYAFNPDGSVKWIHPLPRPILRAMPAISSDGTLYLCNGTSLYAFRWSTGTAEQARGSVGAPASLRIMPNPCAGRTTIFIRTAPGSAVERADIYNTLGQHVRKLDVSSDRGPIQPAQWDGKDEHGRLVESGVYFCRASGTGFSLTGKIVVQK